MDSNGTVSACTKLTGSKRVRCLPIPGGFEELLINLLAERSAVLRTQRECVAEAGGDACIDLPAEVTSHWMQGLCSTDAALTATHDSKIVECLKASAFFQDFDVMKKLTCLLASRLLKAGTEEVAEVGTSHSAQRCSAPRDHSQVLQELPTDLAIDVLHSAPATLTTKIIQLPHLLRPLAVLAECPGLAAWCSPVPECSEAGLDLPVFTVCVDTRQQQGAAEPATAASNEDAANAELWLHTTSDPEANVQNGNLFSLQRRTGTIACRLLARSRTFQGLKIALPDSTCFVFGPACGALNLKNVTFQGGAIVCMGSDCDVTFHDAVFEGCTLIVRAGAQATLERPQFKHTDATRLSVCAHGIGSKVVVKGGTICRGAQAVAVYAGAQFHASNLTITQVNLVGVEVKHEGSALYLNGCKLHDFHPDARCGVLVQASSSAQLSTLSITGMCHGVTVRAHASATLVDCHVAHATEAGVWYTDGGRGCLEGCTLSNSGHGLSVSGLGSWADATNCHFLKNHDGATVKEGGKLKANACTSSGHVAKGYFCDCGGVLDLANCTSCGDSYGVAVIGGMLTSHKVVVTGVLAHGRVEDGFYVSSRGHAVLRECSATKCRRNGIHVRSMGSSLHAEACILQQNGECGALASVDAVAVMSGCHSSGNQKAGYGARYDACMTVINSTSLDDEKDCVVRDFGELTMEGLTVHGILKSGRVAEAAGYFTPSLARTRAYLTEA